MTNRQLSFDVERGVLVGFLSIIAAFTGKMMVPLVGAILSTVISTVYSLVIYLKKKGGGEE